MLYDCSAAGCHGSSWVVQGDNFFVSHDFKWIDFCQFWHKLQIWIARNQCFENLKEFQKNIEDWPFSLASSGYGNPDNQSTQESGRKREKMIENDTTRCNNTQGVLGDDGNGD